jgi:hypothetical protein
MINQLNQNDISILPSLPRDRYENIFKVYQQEKDSSKYYFYNILTKVTIDTENVAPEVFKYIKVERRLPWTSISYQEYKTQYLWWLILLTNGITNPIILPKIGDVLRIVRREYVGEILGQINA